MYTHHHQLCSEEGERGGGRAAFSFMQVEHDKQDTRHSECESRGLFEVPRSDWQVKCNLQSTYTTSPPSPLPQTRRQARVPFPPRASRGSVVSRHHPLSLRKRTTHRARCGKKGKCSRHLTLPALHGCAHNCAAQQQTRDNKSG